MKDRHREPRTGAPYPEIRIIVTRESLPLFTTILQYGVEIDTPANTPLGNFLGRCPGFTEEYIVEAVQTIFLNGTAIDDLQTPLTSPHPIIALSAAMPGLAGAIFRKNGPHGTLRTATHPSASNHKHQGPLAVTLKLFNRIAREKGERLLSSGVVIATPSLSDFLTKRPELRNVIKSATFDTVPAFPEELPRMIRAHAFVKLSVSA
jgi:hypothetical protein